MLERQRVQAENHYLEARDINALPSVVSGDGPPDHG